MSFLIFFRECFLYCTLIVNIIISVLGGGATGASANTSSSASQSSAYPGASAIPDDDEGENTQNVPRRIPSRSSRNKEKTNSEINSKKCFVIIQYLTI